MIQLYYLWYYIIYIIILFFVTLRRFLYFLTGFLFRILISILISPHPSHFHFSRFVGKHDCLKYFHFLSFHVMFYLFIHIWTILSWLENVHSLTWHYELVLTNIILKYNFWFYKNRLYQISDYFNISKLVCVFLFFTLILTIRENNQYFIIYIFFFLFTVINVKCDLKLERVVCIMWMIKVICEILFPRFLAE